MNGRFLIVDDDPINAEILSICLGSLNTEAEVYLNGEDCLRQVDKGNVDMILLDVMMPGISGIDVLEDIRRSYKPIELPIIMVTALGENEMLIEAIEKGANDYISKPINYEVALARISNQITSLRLYKESLQKQKIEAINSMIVTYNHEINNPLSIASAELELARRNRNFDNIDRASEALKRISEIVKKIQKISAGSMRETDYSMGTRMIQLDED